ncbi:MAG TPA: 2-oxoacid:acceptor oxidoreductase family protein [Anaerolineae bacterium]|nr:2-oxoacid:acceptor oxidoreductase family protein [Anaerolineae bacterium]
MAELIEIRWHGRGGQGVVTAGKMLAQVALNSGQYFQAFPDYGPERAGAPIRAFTRMSPNPIHKHCQIQEPDIVLVLDPTLLEAVDVADGLKKDGVLLVNTDQSPARVREMVGFRTGRVFTVDASKIAMETLGREITNTPMLGAFAKATGILTVEEMSAQTRKQFAGKLGTAVVERNVEAIERAADEVQEG